ncbi:hypothetical protein AAY473_008080 [Plecturocebus cupreus]
MFISDAISPKLLPITLVGTGTSTLPRLNVVTNYLLVISVWDPPRQEVPFEFYGSLKSDTKIPVGRRERRTTGSVGEWGVSYKTHVFSPREYKEEADLPVPLRSVRPGGQEGNFSEGPHAVEILVFSPSTAFPNRENAPSLSRRLQGRHLAVPCDCQPASTCHFLKMFSLSRQGEDLQPPMGELPTHETLETEPASFRPSL